VEDLKGKKYAADQRGKERDRCSSGPEKKSLEGSDTLWNLDKEG
jgi:hypothetical protein